MRNNKKMRGKTLFIFLTLVITFIFGFLSTPVYALELELTDWDDVASGLSDGVSGYIEFDYITGGASDFITTSLWSHTSPNSFLINADDGSAVQGYWNLTSVPDAVSEISFWGKLGDLGTGIVYLDFLYNNVSYFKLRQSNLGLAYYSVSGGTYVDIETNLGDADYPSDVFYVEIEHNGTNQYIYKVYNITSTLKQTVEGDGSTSNTLTTLDQINVTTDAVVSLKSTYIDEIKIDTSADTGDVTGYQSIGSTSCAEMTYGAYGTDYLETKFAGYLTTTVHALDLLVDTADDDPRNYYLWLNGQAIGQAEYLFSSGSGQVARWIDFDVVLDNEQLVAEWRHYEADNDDDTVWRWVFGSSEFSDLNGDGYKSYRLHDDINLINGVYDGATAGYDVCWKFYFDPESWTPEPPNPSWTDDLEFSGEGYLGVSPYDSDIESYREYTNVFITWGVSDISQNNYMYIYDDDWNSVGLTQQVYYGESFSPLKLLDGAYDGTVGFVPYNTGNYTVTIVRNSVEVANKTFYVYANTDNYWLYSVPNPSLRDNSYNVYYKYNNSDKDGYLLVFDPYETDIKWGYELQQFYIGSGTDVTGFVTYYPSYVPTKNHLWVIFVEVSNNIFVPQTQHIHIVRDDMYSDNVVSVVHDAIEIGNNQVINYYHNYAGGEVYLFINGVQAYSIGNVQSDSIIYLCDKVGSQNVSMKVLLNDTWYLLSWDTWQTTYEGGEIPPPEGLLPNLGETFGAIMGIIVLALFILLPLALSVQFSHMGHTVVMPNIVYVLMGAIGVLLDVFLGLFAVWVIYFVVAVGILTLGLFYLLNVRSNQGG